MTERVLQRGWWSSANELLELSGMSCDMTSALQALDSEEIIICVLLDYRVSLNCIISKRLACLSRELEDCVVKEQTSSSLCVSSKMR